MSTRKLGVALGAAVLLLGMPTSYALAGNGNGKGEGKPDKAPHQCEDGLDNDEDGLSDLEDPDCGSPRDNSEAAEAPEEPGTEVPGGELPALPAELQAVIDELTAALGGGGEDPGEEEPPAEEPGEEEPPAEQPDPAAELQAVLDELTGGGEPPALPTPDPAALEAALAELQAAVEAAVAEVTGQIPPPPA